MWHHKGVGQLPLQNNEKENENQYETEQKL